MKGQGFLPPQELQGQRCYQQGFNGLLQFPYVAIAWQAGSGPEHSVAVVTIFTDRRCGWDRKAVRRESSAHRRGPPSTVWTACPERGPRASLPVGTGQN